MIRLPLISRTMIVAPAGTKPASLITSLRRGPTVDASANKALPPGRSSCERLSERAGQWQVLFNQRGFQHRANPRAGRGENQAIEVGQLGRYRCSQIHSTSEPVSAATIVNATRWERIPRFPANSATSRVFPSARCRQRSESARRERAPRSYARHTEAGMTKISSATSARRENQDDFPPLRVAGQQRHADKDAERQHDQNLGHAVAGMRKRGIERCEKKSSSPTREAGIAENAD